MWQMKTKLQWLDGFCRQIKWMYDAEDIIVTEMTDRDYLIY